MLQWRRFPERGRLKCVPAPALRSVSLHSGVHGITATASLLAVSRLPPPKPRGCRSLGVGEGVGAASRFCASLESVVISELMTRCSHGLPKVVLLVSGRPAPRNGAGLCSTSRTRRGRLLSVSPQNASCGALCRFRAPTCRGEPLRACSLLTTPKPLSEERMVACEAHLQLLCDVKEQSKNFTSRLPLTPISVTNT